MFFFLDQSLNETATIILMARSLCQAVHGLQIVQFNSIQFKLYFTFVAKWPNGQITGNITFYKTHKITSKRMNLNTLKLHS